MTRSALVAGLSVLGLLAVALLWREEEGDRHRLGDAPLEVRLGVSLQPDAALLMLAEDLGYLEAEGLKVATEQFPSGARVIEDGLRAGRIDVVAVSETPVAGAALEGVEVRVVAQLASADNVNRIVARRDRGITSLADLAGKRLATQRNSAVHYFLDRALRQQGLEGKALEVQFLKAEDLPAALAEGRIDAFSMREPYVSRAVALLGDNAVVLAAPGLLRQFGLLVASAPWLEAHEEEAVRLLRAVARAETFARHEPERPFRNRSQRVGDQLT